MRITERYILSRIYAKIPKFWKRIIEENPQDTGSNKTNENTLATNLDTIRTMRIELSEKLTSYEVSHGTKNRRMPFWLPSAFDASPYVSLDNGEHIDYFGPRIKQESKHTMHNYPLHLWPPTVQKRQHIEETPFDIYNPHEFTLNILEKDRKVLLCERCHSRFRLILCDICKIGMCFQCTLR